MGADMNHAFLRTARVVLATALVGCSGPSDEAGQVRDTDPEAYADLNWESFQDGTDRHSFIEGFSGPEAVRYDGDQDVWFVSNFNGDGGERDGNGFISRVSAETGQVTSLRFAQGTDEHPLHAPRGMYVVGDTLWVADIDGVHGFHRATGAQLTFLDLSSFEPGFLNDVAAGPDGSLYVTDTGESTVYRIRDHEAVVALTGIALGSPNGITWDRTRELLVMVPWEPGARVNTWRIGAEPIGFGPRTTPGRLDGIEPIDKRLLVASQSDSTILLMDAGTTKGIIKVSGRPADIGVDLKRRRVAVPYIALNRVDIWQLPLKN
jgi:DNA-binding beta-propeller fold protein YncE